jgi:hypothetical protein
MAFLPKEALTLKGGCYCQAIRYTINIPALKDRPVVPNALETPIGDGRATKTLLPVVDLDHCNDCRQVSGAIVQCWLICPVGWIDWSLLPKSNTVVPELAANNLSLYTIPENEAEIKSPRLDLRTYEAVGSSTEGQPHTYVTKFNSSDNVVRSFCSRCGTHLAYFRGRADPTPNDVVDVTVGSLDRDCMALVRPDRHGWWNSGVDWVKSILTRGDTNLIRHPSGDIGSAVQGE